MVAVTTRAVHAGFRVESIYDIPHPWQVIMVVQLDFAVLATCWQPLAG